MSAPQTLEIVPNAVVDAGGFPRFGTFRGELPAVALEQLKGDHSPAWWKWRLRRKRWHYTIVVTDEVLVCQAVVDGGYFGQSFLYAVDLYEQRSVATKRFLGLPGVNAGVNDRPARGHHSWFRSPGVDLDLSRGEASEPYRWNCEIHPAVQRQPGGFKLDAQIEAAVEAPALTVISPVDNGGVVNVTQKWSALPARGRLRVGSRTYRLDGGLAGVDYTQGILARRTRWRWAHGMGRLSDGRRVGINLVDGFNDGHKATNENALWVGDELIPLSRATFEYDPDSPERPWVVRSDDGIVDLWFEPYYVFSDFHRWKVIDGHFIQPAGRFEGTIRVDGKRRDVTLFGVTEDQDIHW